MGYAHGIGFLQKGTPKGSPDLKVFWPTSVTTPMALTSLSTWRPVSFCLDNNSQPCNQQQWESLNPVTGTACPPLPPAASLQKYCSPPSLQCPSSTPDS